MFELLFLLLPIAAGYGWYMGQRNAKQTAANEAYRLSREYVDGVSFLLSDQREKAVELFLDLIKDEGNTFEAHLTLGNLFRSRGEIDRAVRIHQALVESASLSFDQKMLAMHQLGLDYMATGIYDRAELIYSELADDEDFQIGALQQLLLIYQATKEMDKAISVAEKLVKLGKESYKMEVAQFYCELALKAISGDDLNKALALLKKSAAANDNCARTSILFGRVYMALADYPQAISWLERVFSQDKDIVSEVLPVLKSCYEEIGDERAWREWLVRCVDEKTGELAELYLADLFAETEGRPVAQQFIHHMLQARPSMKIFYRLMDYNIADAEEGKAKESLILLRDMVGEQIRKSPHYRCKNCGFTANTLYWLCPSCRTWATIKPIHYIEENH